MGKRGRKPKERKGYFYEQEEQAIIEYINSTDNVKREKIFNTILFPALTKMIESIIRRYKLYVPEEEFTQTFNDTISYLLTKVNNFKPVINGYVEAKNVRSINIPRYIEVDSEFVSKKSRNALPEDPPYVKVIDPSAENGAIYYDKKEIHYKAYSYCGTVCKNYLIFKNMQFAKEQQRITPYDTVAETCENDMKYTAPDPLAEDVAVELKNDISRQIEKMINNPNEGLTENEIKVGKALVNILDNWEDVLGEEGSNKMQKSSVLYFLREATMMTTKEVRDNMKCFKSVYKELRNRALE